MDLLGDIVEHDLSGAEALPPKPKQQENGRRKGSNNGFPTARKQRPSRWRQRLEKKGITSISGVVKADRIDQKFSVNAEKIDGTDGLANKKSQREQISQQNLNYVKHMNVSEKEEMRKEILENVNSKTLSLLIKRSRQGRKEKNDQKKEENNEEKKKEDHEKGKKENIDDKNKNSKSEESSDMGTKLVPDVVPVIDADNTWIGGYKNTETATEAKDSGVYIDIKKEDKAAKSEKDDRKKSGEVENGSSDSSLKPVLKKYGSSKQKAAKKVRFNNEAKVQYPDTKGKESDKHNSDDEWEDIEFLDDAGPTYDEARKLSGESAKKTIDHAKFHKREDKYEKIDLADPAFNEKLHEKYFPDLPSNPNQLEWMSNKNVPKTPKVVSYDSIDDLRFDFKGDIITSENIAQHSETTKDGLHNHSAHPELPGYTIPELAQYLQSTYPGQSNRLKSISQDIYNVKHWTEDIEERKDEITKISEDIVDEGLEYDYDELEKNYKEVEQRIRISRSKLENLRGDKELKTTAFNHMKAAVSELQIKIKNLELKSMDKINIERSVEENKKQIQEMENTLKEAEVEISKIQEKYEENILALQKMTNRVEKEKAESVKSISVLKEYSDKSQMLSKDIMDFEENKASILEKTKQEASVLKKKMTEMSSQIEKEENSRRELEKVISDANGQEATISYNLELYSLDDELVSIEEQIGTLDVEKAAAEKSKYVEESQKLQEQQMQHRKEYATRLGQKTQIERQISDIRTEIQRDFKDVNKRYVKQCARLQTKLALVTDLGTCYKATDDGVMKFHHEKMAEINRIIDELWKGTYMGNDVESIMIRADPGASKSRAGTLKTRRSYNYRVVMVKNGVELDMRGRCSAGQKVLASIIIRLALAECFGLNFGMIALDEPTTNLDEENIESLAKALNKIIEMRSVQSNFQLIVITHDEKFLRYMNAVEFTDHYFKVVRDERLHSTINKVKISTLE